MRRMALEGGLSREEDQDVPRGTVRFFYAPDWCQAVQAPIFEDENGVLVGPLGDFNALVEEGLEEKYGLQGRFLLDIVLDL